MKQHHVPETQRAEYNRTLEQAYRYAQEVEPKLPMYFYVLKDADMVRKLIAIVCFISVRVVSHFLISIRFLADLHYTGTTNPHLKWHRKIHPAFEYPLNTNRTGTTGQRPV
jgi:hypothetical protein